MSESGETLMLQLHKGNDRNMGSAMIANRKFDGDDENDIYVFARYRTYDKDVWDEFQPFLEWLSTLENMEFDNNEKVFRVTTKLPYQKRVWLQSAI